MDAHNPRKRKLPDESEGNDLSRENNYESFNGHIKHKTVFRKMSLLEFLIAAMKINDVCYENRDNEPLFKSKRGRPAKPTPALQRD